MSALHRSWLADQPAQAHEGPQTAEDWGNALDKPTPAMLTAAAGTPVKELAENLLKRMADKFAEMNVEAA